MSLSVIVPIFYFFRSSLHLSLRFIRNPGNPGRSLDESIDLTEALKDHYDPELVKSKLAECKEWLKKDSKLTEEEKSKRGWKKAYNLTTWEEFPGMCQQPFKNMHHCWCLFSHFNT